MPQSGHLPAFMGHSRRPTRSFFWKKSDLYDGPSRESDYYAKILTSFTRSRIRVTTS
jgi:hypothetical protein